MKICGNLSETIGRVKVISNTRCLPTKFITKNRTSMNHVNRNNIINSGTKFKILSYFLLFVCTIILFQGCDKKSNQKINIDTEYKAVFLDNGQVFFGRIEEAGPSYLVLKDVYYVRSQVIEREKDKNEVTNTLIKRGSEWHGPDRMYINSNHITLIEPVSPSSRVGELIKEASKK